MMRPPHPGFELTRRCAMTRTTTATTRMTVLALAGRPIEARGRDVVMGNPPGTPKVVSPPASGRQ